MHEQLCNQQSKFNYILFMREVDILRNPDDDVTLDEVWDPIIASIKTRQWDAVILTPPCNTFSRSRHNWKNSPGPRPVRSRDYPFGFPWLAPKNRRICDQGNLFVNQTVEAAQACFDHDIPYLIEHPEDLGAVSDGQVPASIWQWPSVLELQVNTRAVTVAFFQCRFDANTSKPTRILTTFKLVSVEAYSTWPVFNDSFKYMGPLPPTCPHGSHSHKLVGREAGKFRTSAAASYPPAMCAWIAEFVIHTFLVVSKGGGSQTTTETKTTATFKSDIDHSNSAESNPIAHTDHPDSAKSNPTAPKIKDTLGGPHKSGSSHSSITTAQSAGPPMQVHWDNKISQFHDGFGLCSPTRWHPSQRGLLHTAQQAAFIQELRKVVLDHARSTIPDFQKFIISLALGKFKEPPFKESEMIALRKSWFRILDDPTQAEIIPLYQPFYLHAMSQTLRKMGDPDWMILDSVTDSYATGVPLGYMEELPRTPLVFNEKVKWRTYDQSDLVDEMLNYSSAEEAGQALEDQFREEEALGMMYPTSLSVARAEYGDRLKISAQGAIQKPDGTWRPLHDATHGVQINNFITCRDQIEFPKAGESATVLSCCQNDQLGVHFMLGADIKKAHRRIVHAKRDWGLLACRSSNAESQRDTIWINRVGTFGLGSIAYWWSRLAGLCGRLVSRLWLQSYGWQMIFADDVQMLAGGPDKWETLVVAILTWAMLGTPFSWKKFRGGLELDWVGYWLDVRRFEVGLSQKRILWLINWAKQVQDTKLVQQRDFAEGLGRLGFATQVILWIKPFLSPLYAWSAAIPPSTTMRPPVTVLLTLSYIIQQLQLGKHMTPCRKLSVDLGEVFRTDAKGEDQKVVLAGWLLAGSKSTFDAPWFSITLGPQHIPWAFRPEKGSSWASTSLELLATLVAVVLFIAPSSECNHRRLTLAFTGGTDNRSNESLARKRSSTKFPLMFVVMQVSHTLSKLGAVMKLNWRPREQNQEADDLTNDKFDKFDQSNRRHLDWSDIDLSLLNSLLVESETFRLELESLRTDKRRESLTSTLFARHIRKKRKTLKTPWE